MMQSGIFKYSVDNGTHARTNARILIDPMHRWADLYLDVTFVSTYISTINSLSGIYSENKPSMN